MTKHAPLTTAMANVAEALRAEARARYRKQVGPLHSCRSDRIRIATDLSAYDWRTVRGLLARDVLTFDGEHGYRITLNP